MVGYIIITIVSLCVGFIFGWISKNGLIIHVGKNKNKAIRGNAKQQMEIVEKKHNKRKRRLFKDKRNG